MSNVPVLDSTIQKTHEWLKDITDGLGFPISDRHSRRCGRRCIHCATGCRANMQRSSEPSCSCPKA